jgi:type IV pilus assembly protein PilM
MKLNSYKPERLCSVGIDFGTRSTKIVSLSKYGARIDINSAGSIATLAGGISAGEIDDPKVFSKSLKQFVQHHKIDDYCTTFDIPSNLAILRWIKIPKLEDAELQEVAKFKVKRHLPFSLDSAYIEAAVTDTSEDELTALVIAVPKQIIDSRAEALLYAGLNPKRAELEAQAILRIVERRLSSRSALWRDASLTIIDFGATNTHMYVIQNQQLQFMRGVKFGSQMFHKAISSGLGITYEQTDDILHNPLTKLSMEGVLTLPFEDSFAIVNISQELEKLTKEVLRLMRYFRSLHPERSYAGILDKAILCGGLVGLNGFAEYLETHLGLSIEFARPIAGMMTKFSKETFANVSNRQEAYTIVMGLALSGLKHQAKSQQEDKSENEFNWNKSA